DLINTLKRRPALLTAKILCSVMQWVGSPSTTPLTEQRVCLGHLWTRAFALPASFKDSSGYEPDDAAKRHRLSTGLCGFHNATVQTSSVDRSALVGPPGVQLGSPNGLGLGKDAEAGDLRSRAGRRRSCSSGRRTSWWQHGDPRRLGISGPAQKLPRANCCQTSTNGGSIHHSIRRDHPAQTNVCWPACRRHEARRVCPGGAA